MERSNRNYLYCLIFLLFASCASDVKKLDNGWSRHDEYMFDYRSEDDSLSFDLLFHIRLNRDYGYRNLNFELMVVAPDYKMYCDTLSIEFGDYARYGAVENKILISDMILTKGDYRFRIKQVMSDTLWGVREINLRMVPEWGKIK